MFKTVLILICFSLLKAQISVQISKKYEPLPKTATIWNPERGFYVHTEVYSNNYEPLDDDSLSLLKSENRSIILRLFYLESFLKTDISSTYLNNVKSDFDLIRKHSMKCIVRFAYSDSDNSKGSYDASKPQMLKHISQLKPILEQNSDIILVLQSGFIGAWGEWYFTDYFGNEGKLSSTDYNNRRDILLALLSALPKNRMVQIRTPFFKRKLLSTNLALTRAEAFDQSNKSRVGHHNDCFLASSDDYGTYTDISIDYPYLASETLYTLMGGETCNPNPPRSNCPTALAELKKFHWSYLNIGYHPTVIDGFKKGGCFKQIENNLGYRFELVNATFPDKLYSRTLEFQLTINNTGFASLFNERSVYLVLRKSSKEYLIKLKTDPRFWSANSITTITESFNLPPAITTGSYQLFLNLPDPSSLLNKRPEYSIRLANQNLWESRTGYNNLLHTIVI